MASCPVWQYAYCCQNVISYRSTTVSKEKNREEMKREGERRVKHEEKEEEEEEEE
jgi:hypothetical protein